ncbi:MAG: PilZ domain-containing protein [Candidatus Omnitrophota bacterium]|nr:MAG: PilZ domain-containing protein [Candidatus Omnitrophota bacterium]
MRERRQYVRLSEALKIVYKIVNPPPDGQSGSFTENISGGGIRFAVKQRLKRGLVLSLEIYLPGFVEPIVATGEVVWVHRKEDLELPYSVGIKFITIDLVDRGKILSYIRQKIVENKSPEISWID